MSEKIESYDHLIRSLESGKLHGDLCQALHELMAAIQQAKIDGTKSPAGSLIIELKFKAEGRTMDIVSKITTKPPAQPNRERTTFFVTPDNRLTRRDPVQMDFDDVIVRSVPDDRSKVITDAG